MNSNKRITDFLIDKIKGKKYFLFDEFIVYVLKGYFKENPILLDKLYSINLQRSNHVKKIVKDIRGILHRISVVYNIRDLSKRKKIFEELTKFIKEDTFYSEKSFELHENLLKTHLSSRERIPYYERLYERIFEITGKPSSILDLGSGMNPLSFVFMKLNKIKYSAYDIDESVVILLIKYFNKISKFLKIEFNTGYLNLLERPFKALKEADICFLFNVLELLEFTKSHKVSENLIVNIPTEHIVVSFPKKTISLRSMKKVKREWFEIMLKRLKYDFSKFEILNEIFYVITKTGAGATL